MSKVSRNSALGEVNAWCTAVQAPEPTATSPLASASVVGSNSGASSTHTNAHADSSMRLQRLPISTRAAPSRARELLAAPAPKKMQSPGWAPTKPASPGRSASERFLATGPPSSPSSPTST